MNYQNQSMHSINNHQDQSFLKKRRKQTMDLEYLKGKMLFDIISRPFDNLYKGKIVLTKVNFYIFRRKKK